MIERSDGASPDGRPTLLTLSAVAGQKTYRERVADVLEAALISGEMLPGELYSAPALASLLGVSATPVREAMADLARVGMVEVVRNRGYRITELSDKELDDINDLRGLIEVPTVARIAEACGEEDVERLRPLAAEIEAAAQARDLVGYIEADNRFHRELLSLSGNAQLVTTVGELRSKSRMYGLHDLADRGLLTESAKEHAALLDLVAAHDAMEAEKLMHRHIRHVRGMWAGHPEP